jgi:hypothetical protein
MLLRPTLLILLVFLLRVIVLALPGLVLSTESTGAVVTDGYETPFEAHTLRNNANHDTT